MKAKSSLIATILFAFSCAAMAQSALPASVQKQFKPLQVQSLSMNKGVLKAVFKKDVVKYPVFSLAVRSVCSTYWSGAKDVATFRPVRLEVLNSAATQGFALAKVATECATLGTSRDSAAHLKTKAWVCVAGNCRERRPGEKTSGDE